MSRHNLPPTFHMVKLDEAHDENRRLAAALGSESRQVTKLRTALHYIVNNAHDSDVIKVAEEALRP